MSKLANRIARSVGVTALVCSLVNCGGNGFSIGLGGGTSTGANDARPTGTPVAQGQFFGQNGKTVSGSALIFLSAGQTYILRLEGMSLPEETGMTAQVWSKINGQMATVSVRSSTGNQNLRFTVSNLNPGFANVYIYSTANGMNYGSAQLTSL